MTGTGKLKGLRIGAGYFSRFQYEAWTRHPRGGVAAICDRSEDKARALMPGNSASPRYYSDWRAMIDQEKPISPTSSRRLTLTKRCALMRLSGACISFARRRSLPICTRCVQAHRCISRPAGVRFMVHENFRWQPWIARSRRSSNRGQIGEFTHIHFLVAPRRWMGDDAYLARQPFFRDYPRLLNLRDRSPLDRYLSFSARRDQPSVYANLRLLNPVDQRRGDRTGLLLASRVARRPSGMPTGTTKSSLPFAAVHIRQNAHRAYGRASRGWTPRLRPSG